MSGGNARACHYRDYPAVKIGRLGVRQEAQGRGVGRDFLDILRTFFLQDNRTGCRIMTVDAYAASIRFYEKNGFQFFSEDDSGHDTRAIPRPLPIKSRLTQPLPDLLSVFQTKNPPQLTKRQGAAACRRGVGRSRHLQKLGT